MNNDLISREYVKSKICDLYSDEEKANEKDIIINEVIDIIDNAPTITDRSVEIAQKSMELGRRVGRAEAELYREETCRSKDSCDDYKYWHCVGCNGCKKGGAI